MNPAAEVGRIARAAGVLYLLDACQSRGADRRERGADRLRYPERDRAEVPARAAGDGCALRRRAVCSTGSTRRFIDRHSATWSRAGRLRAGTPVRGGSRPSRDFVAARPGWRGRWAMRWRSACRCSRRGSQALAARLRAALAEVPGVTLPRPGARETCGIVTFASDRMPSREIVARLGAQGINVSLSSPLGAARLCARAAAGHWSAPRSTPTTARTR